MKAAAPSQETRFGRGAALVLALALGLAALVVAVTVGILAQPNDGWLIPANSQTSTLSYFYGDWPTPLRAGDEVLAAFGASVRDEVELEALTEHLVGVVDETMQPQTISVWLRSGASAHAAWRNR